MRARPRLFIAAAVAIAVSVFLPTGVASHSVTRWLIAWNAGAGLYVVLAAIMMIRSSNHHMRHRAQLQDDGQLMILSLVVVATIASLAAIAGELAVVKDMHGFIKGAHIALAGATVLSSWAFIQVMFALHYAHDYYTAVCQRRKAGLQFPDDEEPDHGDFFYFASVIGTSGQTADVSFVSKPTRRIGSLHCILAYLFNTTVLALLIKYRSKHVLKMNRGAAQWDIACDTIDRHSTSSLGHRSSRVLTSRNLRRYRRRRGQPWRSREVE